MNAAPTTAPGREKEVPSSSAPVISATKSNKRSSYDMHRQYQDAMDMHEMTTATSEQHVDEERQAPLLPPKSALRASRLLSSLKIAASAEPLEFSQPPHEEYLSSEEDASSTSGDFSDFEYDSSSDDVPSPTQECSMPVTARVVSVVYFGKPSVVHVPQVRRSISPNSIERPSSMGGLSDKTSHTSDELKSRRTSVSTTVSSRSSRSLNTQRPPPLRSSSMQPPSDASNERLGFLLIDPFANGSSYSLTKPTPEPVVTRETKPVEEPETPKTPKSSGSRLKGVARAMSLMKKRSMPRLSQGYLTTPELGFSSQPTSPVSISEQAPVISSMSEALAAQKKLDSEAAALSPALSRPPLRPIPQPVTHDEIIRIAKRNEQNKHLTAPQSFHGDLLASPVSPPTSPLSKDTTSGKRVSSFGFARRRMSVKLPGGKFQL
ncbi:unnamed protein product [Discula destructiva]